MVEMYWDGVYVGRQVLHKTKAGELIEIRLPLFCAQSIDSDGDIFYSNITAPISFSLSHVSSRGTFAHSGLWSFGRYRARSFGCRRGRYCCARAALPARAIRLR